VECSQISAGKAGDCAVKVIGGIQFILRNGEVTHLHSETTGVQDDMQSDLTEKLVEYDNLDSDLNGQTMRSRHALASHSQSHQQGCSETRAAVLRNKRHSEKVICHLNVSMTFLEDWTC
jgi:hypothetical protein